MKHLLYFNPRNHMFVHNVKGMVTKSKPHSKNNPTDSPVLHMPNMYVNE